MPNSGHSQAIVLNRAGGAVDRRIARTRQSLCSAFIELVLDRGYGIIGIGDIVDRANVGRSTFYAHFKSKDELLIATMQWMFDILADAVRPDAPADALHHLVSHFWSNRRLAQTVLSHPIEPKLRRALAETIAGRLALHPDARLAAVRIASAQLGVLAAWTRGEVAATPGAVAESIRIAARARA